MRFVLIAFIICSNVLVGQETFLRINPSGHQGQIRDLLITNDGKYAVTASFDKSIKKWNLKTGEIEQEFRSEIGVGAEGMVYYIALSPDNKYLASCGWFGPDDESGIIGDIRIFDFKTGKISHVLKGLNNSSRGLGFSSDSKYLIAGDAESRVLKWELATQRVVADFTYHSTELGKELERITINDDRMVTAGFDGKFCLWDINKPGKPIKEDKKFFKEALLNDIGDIAISENGEEIAVSLNHFIIIYTKNFKPYFVIENKEKPGFLSFSADGTRLLTGSVKSGEDPHHCYVFEKNGANWTEYTSFDLHKQSVLAGEFVDKEHIVTGGGEKDEICYWEIKELAETPKLNMKMYGKGKAYYASSLNQDKIAFAENWSANQGNSKLERSFDLFQKSFDTISNESGYNKPLQEFLDFKLSTYNEGGYSITNPNLEIVKNEKPYDTIFRESWNGSRHNVYTFTPSGDIVSGGSQGIMVAYDKKGNELNYFVGHEGDIWGATISADKTRLITCGSDQTIRIWPLDNVGVEHQNPSMMSVWDYVIEMDAGEVYHKIFKRLKIEVAAKESSNQSWQYIINSLRKNGYPADFIEKKLFAYKSTVVYPIVSIFIAEDGEWIIWNEEGYFSASKKGAQNVGYHVNKGEDQEARFYPFGQFDLKYNRPDIILKDLSMGDAKIIEFYHMAYVKRLKKMGISEEQLSSDIHLPEVEILDFNLNGNKIDLSIQSSDSKYKLNRVNVYINDVPIFGAKGQQIKNESTFNSELSFDLANGKNRIEISVLNNKGVESMRENLLVTVEGNKKPNLYVVTIGTSQFKDERYNLKYAGKDALDVEKSFLEDAVYGEVFHKSLIDRDVTKENILNVKSFLESAGRNDVVIVFLAGHGLLDKNFDYYYATHDIDFNNPSERGIVYSELEKLLDGIASLKKVLFMDTCHSGEVDKDDIAINEEEEEEQGDILFRAAGVGVQRKNAAGLGVTAELVKELFSDVRRGTGATVISSAGGMEFAMEGADWKNGLFTYCLLDALTNNSADANKDGKTMLSELQLYLQKRVNKISKGKQVPTSRIENLSLDFQIK